MSLIVESLNGAFVSVKGSDMNMLEIGDRLYTEAEMGAAPPTTPLEAVVRECNMMRDKGIILDPRTVGRMFMGAMGMTADNDLCDKEDRYKDANGKDTIDKWIERYPLETFRVIMWIQMEKYNDRLGKKDSPVEEVRKIAKYSARWLKVEEGKL